MIRERYGIPPVVQSLMIVNVALWLLANVMPLRILALFPLGSPWFHWWQVFTHMFMHGGAGHVLVNMFMLWMFGRYIELDLGSRRFLIYYLVCGLGAGVIQLLVCELASTPLDVPTVGASGAVFGILLAFGRLHPNDIIVPLIPPIPMKAKWAVVIFGVIELLSGIRSSMGFLDNVAHFAHIGGMLWGWGLLWLWKKQGKIYY